MMDAMDEQKQYTINAFFKNTIHHQRLPFLNKYTLASIHKLILTTKHVKVIFKLNPSPKYLGEGGRHPSNLHATIKW